jgi:hypothetical protein
MGMTYKFPYKESLYIAVPAVCQAVTAVHHPSVDLSATKVAGSIPYQATFLKLTPGTSQHLFP